MWIQNNSKANSLGGSLDLASGVAAPDQSTTFSCTERLQARGRNPRRLPRCCIVPTCRPKIANKGLTHGNHGKPCLDMGKIARPSLPHRRRWWAMPLLRAKSFWSCEGVRRKEAATHWHQETTSLHRIHPKLRVLICLEFLNKLDPDNGCPCEGFNAFHPLVSSATLQYLALDALSCPASKQDQVRSLQNYPQLQSQIPRSHPLGQWAMDAIEHLPSWCGLPRPSH